MRIVVLVAVVLADEQRHSAEAAVELVSVSGLALAPVLVLTSEC